MGPRSRGRIGLASLVVLTGVGLIAVAKSQLGHPPLYRCEEPQHGTCHESEHYMTRSECRNRKGDSGGCPWLGRRAVCENTSLSSRTYYYGSTSDGPLCPTDRGWRWRTL